VLDKFDLPTQIARLDRANLLYKVVAKFCDLDLHPDAVSNLEMGYLYEELVCFSELSNETAGEHFTPREVIQLMVRLLFIEDDALLTMPGIVKILFDPACGTGGAAPKRPLKPRVACSDLISSSTFFHSPDQRRQPPPDPPPRLAWARGTLAERQRSIRRTGRSTPCYLRQLM